MYKRQEETCLERFARAVRAGYDDFIQSGGSCEYERFSEEMRWDKELFLQVYYELLGSVSYTHLDVYKRQHLRCTWMG